MLYLVERFIGLIIGLFIVAVGVYFSRDLPTVGATGEAMSIGGNFYPTGLVMWFFWTLTLSLSGVFILYALRPLRK
jgi:uncharacterized membrane protein